MAIKKQTNGYEVRLEFRATYPTAEEANRAQQIVHGHITRARTSLQFGAQPPLTLREGVPAFLRYQKTIKQNLAETLTAHERQLSYFVVALGRRSVDLPLDQISIERLQTAVDTLLTNRQPGTVNKYLGSLFAFGRWARTKSARLPTGYQLPWLDMGRVRTKRRSVSWLSVDGFRAAMNAWPHSARHLALVFWMMVFTGARPGVLLALCWRDISLPTRSTPGLIRLQTAKGGRLETISFGRNSSLHQLLLAIIEMFARLWHRPHRAGDPVFTPSKGSVRRWTSAGFSRAVRYHADRASMPDFRAYTIRHSSLTWLAQDGLSDDIRKNFAGHTNTSQQATYVHTSGEDGRPARDAMEVIIGGSLAVFFAADSDPEKDDPAR